MRDFLIVFKVLLKNQNSRRVSGNGKRKLSSSVTMILSMLPLVLLFCVVGGFLAVIIKDVETLSLVSNVVVTVVQLFALFISMFSVMNTLYNSPDTPFLNTLPVSHTAVFFAKFALSYLGTLSLMASLILPPLLTISIVYTVLGGAMFYGYFALIFIVVLVSPVLPLFIVTLFSMPMSYLGTFFKGKSVLKTVLSLLFYIAIMVAYLLLIYYLSTNGAESSGEGFSDIEMTGQALAGLGIFAKVMYPNKVLLDFALGIDMGKSFGISFAITIGMLAVMLVLSMLFYRRINERRLETHNDTSHSAVSYKQTGIVVSLMKKDFKHIIRNSQLAMSCLANILICPVITAIMYFAGDMQSTAQGMSGYMESILKLSYMVLYSTLFLGGTNMMAMLAYTREGKSFYISKAMPISARDNIKAKFFLALIPSGIVMLIQVILAFALYKLDVLSVMLFLICTSLTVVGATALHIYCDMRFGNVNWNTQQDMKQVSQGNKGSILVVFLVVFIGCFAMIGGMVLSVFAESIGIVAVLAVYWTVFFVLSAAMCIAGVLVLRYKAEPYFDEIGERQFKAKVRTRMPRGSKGGGNMLIR